MAQLWEKMSFWKKKQMQLEENIDYKFVESNDGDVLWFNARENAVKFYQNYGFSIQCGPFEIPEIGTHFVLFKCFVD